MILNASTDKKYQAFEQAARAFSLAEATAQLRGDEVKNAEQELEELEKKLRKEIQAKETQVNRLRDNQAKAEDLAAERKRLLEEAEALAHEAGVPKKVMDDQKRVFRQLHAAEMGAPRPRRITTAPKNNASYPQPPEDGLYFTRAELAKLLDLKIHQIEYLHKKEKWGFTVYSGADKAKKKVPWYGYRLDELPEKYAENPKIAAAWAKKEKKAKARGAA